MLASVWLSVALVQPITSSWYGEEVVVHYALSLNFSFYAFKMSPQKGMNRTTEVSLSIKTPCSCCFTNCGILISLNSHHSVC